MSCLKLSLVFLLFVAVRPEGSSSPGHGSGLPESEVGDKLSEKRWTQDDRRPTFPEEPPTLNLQTKSQERAKEEKTFKDFVAYEGIQSVLVNALKPRPIVDTAEESEKLAPNDGSRTRALGDFIVKGTETLSRALNAAIDVPKKAINKLSTGATQALNQLGAYLVGL